MAKQAARIETKAAEIASDFGGGLALRWFGQEIVDSLPRYVRGAKAGKPKGWIVWDKVAVGGWDNGAGVVLPNSILRIRLGGHRYLFNSSDELWWYKSDPKCPPDPCGAIRVGEVGKRVMRQRAAEQFQREVARVAASWAICKESILASAAYDAISREVVRRMAGACPECDGQDIASNGERGFGRTLQCQECWHQWMPSDDAR
jgi:ssDNA-binding Zn-finger/Zn-ribbon topoisomerase 1